MKNIKEFRYAFVYKDEDLAKGKISAEFSKEKKTEKNVNVANGFIIDLIAYDKYDKEYEICISLNLTEEDLNKIPNKFISIADKVCYIDFYEPDSNRIPTIDLSPVDLMFANPGNIWVLKEKEDTYFFKMSVPEEHLFIWFYLENDMIVHE